MTGDTHAQIDQNHARALHCRDEAGGPILRVIVSKQPKEQDVLREPVIDLLRPRLTPVVTGLALLNITVFIVTFWGLEDGGSARRFLALWPTTHHRIFVELWRLVTFQFMHLNPPHLMLNLFVIIQGGPVLERRFGSLRFLAFYLGSAALAAFLYEMLILACDPSLSGHYPRLAGASGGVYAIMAAILALEPRTRLKIWRFALPFRLVLAAVVVIDNFQLRGLRDGGEIIHLFALGVGWTATRVAMAVNRNRPPKSAGQQVG